VPISSPQSTTALGYASGRYRLSGLIYGPIRKQPCDRENTSTGGGTCCYKALVVGYRLAVLKIRNTFFHIQSDNLTKTCKDKPNMTVVMITNDHNQLINANVIIFAVAPSRVVGNT